MTKITDALWSAVAKFQPRDGSRAISASEALARVESGEALLLDVREAGELGSGLAAPAIWVPTSDIDRNGERWQSFVKTLSADRLVIVYCAAGMRAEKVGNRLAEQGFQVANMGGFKDWTAAGLPTRLHEA